ncbi:MAG: peptidase T [Clostridia bacterium]|nr:peptidase T [Clostridia bacterium]
MKTHERFLNYVRIHTASSEDSTTVPTTARQFDLAKLLVEELHALGIENARVDDKCYVYASIPATAGCENAPALGFIAHMDTVPDFSGENVQPRIIENYDGGEVVLGNSGRTLSPEKLPHLPSLKGKTLIVTDGTTVLGGDDKAGIAEIITAVERILSENIPHGKICIGFTPDEEVGSGADNFDVAAFGADFAYTVDGGVDGEIEYENFNAAGAKVVVNGFNIHPGDSKNKMINALLVAMEFNAMLPAETPANTEGYEGFFHLTDMGGSVEKCEMSYILRDHSSEIMTARKATMEHAAKILNEKYGAGTVELGIRDQYRNMKEKIEPCMHLIENAIAAAKELGIEPRVQPIRGGTDGARLSFMGLPCPNLGTGDFACHGPYEHVTVEGMEKCTELVVKLVEKYAGFVLK